MSTNIMMRNILSSKLPSCCTRLHPLAVKINPRIIGYRSINSDSGAYAGDGKTTVRIANDDSKTNFIKAFSGRGFRLANNLFIQGSILVFPTHVFSWNVKRGIDITPESLVIFELIVPKVKMVIIGYGSKNEKFNAKIPMYFKERGITCEMLPTHHAVTTYNFLVDDSVHCAAAFLPPRDLYVVPSHETSIENETFDINPDDFSEAPGSEIGEELKEKVLAIDRDRGKTKFDE